MKLKKLGLLVLLCQSVLLYGSLSEDFAGLQDKISAYKNQNLMAQQPPSRIKAISMVYNLGSDIADEARHVLGDNYLDLQRLNDILRKYKSYLNDLENAPNQSALDAVQTDMARGIIPATIRQAIAVAEKSQELLGKAAEQATMDGASRGAINKVNELSAQLLSMAADADRLAIYQIRSDTNTGLRDLENRLRLAKAILVSAESILGADSDPIRNLREQVGVLARDVKDMKELYDEGNETNMRAEMERISRNTMQETLMYAARVARLAASR